MNLSIGILIIGSLRWDDKNDRKPWRLSRLKLGQEIRVKVPICYGRKSGSRGDSYTMVFNDDKNFGSALAVPCRNPGFSYRAIRCEAEYLWEAEDTQNPQGAIAKGWGCVALLVNPICKKRAEIEQFWESVVLQESSYNEAVRRIGGFVSNTGLINFWPKKVNGDKLNEFDILLTTANEPNASSSSPVNIAEKWKSSSGKLNKYSEYFFENRKKGIITYQDPEILQALRR